MKNGKSSKMSNNIRQVTINSVNADCVRRYEN